jgi:hypothetical protein
MIGDMFVFELLELVEIDCSGEQGHIVARLNSSENENKYLVRYQNAAGIGVEEFWSESALTGIIAEEVVSEGGEYD